jgi:putative transposase
MGNAPFVFRQYGYFVVELYHLERNHQGLGNRLIVPPTATVKTVGPVQRRQRLGGMLNYYHRAAA